jgi:AcrR family transcriptional regulator
MSPVKESTARERILRNAEHLFARQGYDATSVDLIASRARANKALIYYYFKSKDGLRDALFAHVQQDFIGFMDRFLSQIPAEKLRRLSALETEQALRAYSRKRLERFIQEMIAFLEEHRDALKLVMTESLKTASDCPAIFRFFETIFRDQLAKAKARGVPYAAGARELIYEFFTGFMPLVTFIILHDQWARHFKVAEAEVKRDFMDSFIKTHVLQTERRKYRIGGNAS